MGKKSAKGGFFGYFHYCWSGFLTLDTTSGRVLLSILEVQLLGRRRHSCRVRVASNNLNVSGPDTTLLSSACLVLRLLRIGYLDTTFVSCAGKEPE